MKHPFAITCTASTAAGTQVVMSGAVEALLECAQALAQAHMDVHTHAHTHIHTHHITCTTIDWWDGCTVILPVSHDFKIHTF